MSAGGLSYDCLNTNRRITLPSVEMWNTNMNILKDPKKSIMTRKIDKVGDTQSILLAQENSGDRIAESINVYARGVNPMVSVSYDNFGNNSGSKSLFAKNANAKLPYKFEVFRPPVIRQEQLMPLSRQPREWFYALTNPVAEEIVNNKTCNELKKSIISNRLNYEINSNLEKKNNNLVNENLKSKTFINQNIKNPQRLFQSDIISLNNSLDNMNSNVNRHLKDNLVIKDQIGNVKDYQQSMIEPQKISDNHFQTPIQPEVIFTKPFTQNTLPISNNQNVNRYLKDNLVIEDQISNVKDYQQSFMTEPQKISDNHFQTPIQPEVIFTKPFTHNTIPLSNNQNVNRYLKENLPIENQIGNVKDYQHTMIIPQKISNHYFQNSLQKEYNPTIQSQYRQGTTPLHISSTIKENPLKIEYVLSKHVNSSIEPFIENKLERSYDKKIDNISYQTQLSMPDDQLQTNYNNYQLKNNLNIPIQSFLGTNDNKIGLDQIIYDDTYINNINNNNLNIQANTNLKYNEKYGDLGYKTNNQRRTQLIENTQTITNKEAFGHDLYQIQSRDAYGKTNHQLQMGSFSQIGSYIPQFERENNNYDTSNNIENEYNQIKRKATSQYMERYNDIYK